MGKELNPGTIIRTTYGEQWTVRQLLGEGGQGYVYLVEQGPVVRALKWYKPCMVSRGFYDHLRKNIMDGPPSSGYIWPRDITEYNGDGFGYIMDLRPDGFCDMTDILLKKADFSSFRRVVDASLNIVNDLRVLHNKGYSYQDLNDGNFFINPKNGRVLICDNDNVATNGESTNVLGKPRYMAPEIVLRKNKPNIYSDRFSLALIIFRLLTMGHPLEGKRAVGRTLTPEMQRAIYGSDPIFLFDPKDDRNRPDPNIHRNESLIWFCLPGYMQRIFLRAFGKEGLKNPNSRPTEADWIDSLVRFRSGIVTCGCGNEVFVNDRDEAVCDSCGNSPDIPFWLDLPEYRIPAVRDSRLYRSQTGIVNPDQALEPVGRVLSSKKDPRKLGIRNMSQESWQAVTTKGQARTVKPGEVIPLKNGIRFRADDTTITIRGGK